MAELKTKVTKLSVPGFLKTIEDPQKRKDSQELLKLFESVTGEKGKIWGTNIIGFGMYHYKSEKSKQEGDWPLTGFSPRKANLTLYIMPGFKEYQDLLAKLGPHKTSVGCLYIKRLSDIDVFVLKKIIAQSVKDMKKKYNQK